MVQDNFSFSSVAQRRQKVGHPCLKQLGFSPVRSFKEQGEQCRSSRMIALTPFKNGSTTNKKCSGGCGARGTLVCCWWECRLVQQLWKIVWSFIKELKMKFPFDPAIPVLGIYPKEPKTPIQKNMCTPMFIAVLFTKPRSGTSHAPISR